MIGVPAPFFEVRMYLALATALLVALQPTPAVDPALDPGRGSKRPLG
jgi:hypothetical protein